MSAPSARQSLSGQTPAPTLAPIERSSLTTKGKDEMTKAVFQEMLDALENARDVAKDDFLTKRLHAEQHQAIGRQAAYEHAIRMLQALYERNEI